MLIDIPRDVQLELADAEFPKPSPHQAPELSEETRSNLQDAARLMNEAERPLIITGHGVLASGGAKELQQLAEATGIPVITTLLGLSGFPQRTPPEPGYAGDARDVLGQHRRGPGGPDCGHRHEVRRPGDREGVHFRASRPRHPRGHRADADRAQTCRWKWPCPATPRR